MIQHFLLNDQYQATRDQWEAFLKPYENSVTKMEIDYGGDCPILFDEARRKFQIDFQNDKTNYAKYKGGINSEPISRALGSGKLGKRVLDLSAGLGVDSVFLAQLGYQVTGVERNPFIYIALKTALDHLTANYQSHLKFVFDHAQNFLQNNTQEFDVCYFDPMFPTKAKSALPKQEMVFFKNLVGSDEDATTVIETAVTSKKFKRCVVKRPLSAEPLIINKVKPAGDIKGKIIRYDIYTS